MPLVKLCKNKNIRLEDLSAITGIGIATLYKINAGKIKSPGFEILTNIYESTKILFGEGFHPADYLEKPYYFEEK